MTLPLLSFITSKKCKDKNKDNIYFTKLSLLIIDVFYTIKVEAMFYE